MLPSPAVSTIAQTIQLSLSPVFMLAGIGALLLLYLETTTVLIGLGTLALAVVVHLLGRRVRPVDPSHDTRTAQEATP